jgi:4-amino-4-deoxy-L-arabinose transferase-like glycosyltransferase
MSLAFRQPVGSDHPSRSQPRIGRDAVQLAMLLAVAAMLRIAHLLSHQPEDYFLGGDGPWYVQQAWLIARGEMTVPLATVGPLYPLILVCFWLFFPTAENPALTGAYPAGFLLIVRLVQIAASLVMVWLGYRIARSLAGTHTAGLITAFGLGIGPAFVMAPSFILTEPAFMALLTLAVWLWLRAVRQPSIGRFVSAGVILALAALTRPVVLLLPVVLAPSVWMAHGFRRGILWLAVLVGALAITVLPWTIYLCRTTGSPIPEGFSSNLWIGAVGEGEWDGSQKVDERRQGLGDDGRSYVDEALRVVGSDPLHWIGLRARRLAAAVLTPHGLVDLGGPSLKQLLSEWWAGDQSIAGLWAIMTVRTFPVKLVIYVLHYLALAFAALGAWISLKRSRDVYVVVAVIAYLVAAYSLLTILPRYLFPAEVFAWVLAGAGFSWLWSRYQDGRHPPKDEPHVGNASA